MLEIRKLETGYEKRQVLFDLSLEVHKKEIVALIGPNGAGKSTILKAVFGLIPIWIGEISFCGLPINGATPAQNFRHGITFAPQGSRVFHDLTVMENIEIGGGQLPRKKAQERIMHVLEVFPGLKKHTHQNAGKLSGGEQQMLALARSLVTEPKLLMLDEPSLGLSPNNARVIFEKIVDINSNFNISVLIVEQKVREVLRISNRVYSIKLGKVAFEGSSDDLQSDKEKLRQLFI